MWSKYFQELEETSKKSQNDEFGYDMFDRNL